MSAGSTIDLDRLLKLRLVVARFGEMDLAKWWNTKGQLGKLGAAALRRGFPRTHYFAQASSVFAVAAHRCAEVFEPPNSVTLWRLPETVEEEFDARWEHWLDNAADWTAFFQKVEALQGADLVATLRAFEVVDERAVEAFSRLRRSRSSASRTTTPRRSSRMKSGASRRSPASCATVRPPPSARLSPRRKRSSKSCAPSSKR
jgi:hypothetical protein